ncbi:MAG: ferritin [Candidatus Hodarchaeales archaeon]|jgi:ferritin
MSQISEKMNNALNDQIKVETESAYIYLAMSYFFAEKGLKNLTNWFKKQSDEEFLHAEKFAHHILERNGHVKLLDISAPNTNEWNDTAIVLKEVLKHEQFVTGKIHELVILAEELKDISIKPLLDWFVNEQIEEEATARDLIDMQAGYSPLGDFYFDERVTRQSESE